MLTCHYLVSKVSEVEVLLNQVQINHIQSESQTSDPEEDTIFSIEPIPASSEIIHQSSSSSSIHPASTINVSNVLTVKPNISMIQVEIGKEPLNYWLWHALCILYATQNDLDGAIEACKTGIQKSPSNPSPLMELMNLYAANGDYKAAMGCGLGLLNIKTAVLQVALTSIRYPLIMSIVSDIESKQNSLEL